MSVAIRSATPSDEPEWRRLWAGDLAFYAAVVPDSVTASTWARIVDPASGILCRVAERDGGLGGIAVAVVHPCTWELAPVCYLEDLYVEPADRGAGVGRALIGDLLGLCRARGYARLYWHTRSSNGAARRLYDSFAPADDFVRYRMFLS